MLYLAADHAGFELKEKIKAFLKERGIAFEDMGAYSYDKDDDYPDFAYSAAKKVAENSDENRAIVICGSGIGVSITANKVKGVYCALVWNREVAKRVSEHNNNPNAIALPASYIDSAEAFAIVDIFLKPSSSLIPERHQRRFRKVREVESEII
ncbi:MAG: hypothetical protein A3H07_02945 [Candidatus Jacksonbacteria bacterium RIFCSPLOWO2_12_FULL_44_15b]|nr:MAG: hypothetical protein A3H07_02945 [Candidatus Jacksonbacteria bacterium RIFCSPLOWO2_12_FULL_44_15b]